MYYNSDLIFEGDKKRHLKKRNRGRRRRNRWREIRRDKKIELGKESYIERE